MYYTKPKGLYFGTVPQDVRQVPDGQGVPAMGERQTEILTDGATIAVSCFLVALGLDMAELNRQGLPWKEDFSPVLVP